MGLLTGLLLKKTVDAYFYEMEWRLGRYQDLRGFLTYHDLLANHRGVREQMWQRFPGIRDRAVEAVLLKAWAMVLSNNEEEEALQDYLVASAAGIGMDMPAWRVRSRGERCATCPSRTSGRSRTQSARRTA